MFLDRCCTVSETIVRIDYTPLTDVSHSTCAALIVTNDQDLLPSGTFLALRKCMAEICSWFPIDINNSSVPLAVFIVFGIQRVNLLYILLQSKISFQNQDMCRVFRRSKKKKLLKEVIRLPVPLEVTITRTVNESFESVNKK